MSKKLATRQTDKQRKLLRLISENLSSKGFTKTMYEMLLEAGYSETSAKQQSLVLAGEGLKSGIDELLSTVDKIRRKALSGLEGARYDKASYRDLIDSAEKLTKIYQLLSGGQTERGEIKVTWEK